MNSIDDIDFESIQKASPFEVEEEEHKFRIIIKGKYQNLAKLVSLYSDPSGKQIDSFMVSEKLHEWGNIKNQTISFWGDHIIIQSTGCNNPTKELRYIKDLQPTTYKILKLYNQIYKK